MKRLEEMSTNSPKVTEKIHAIIFKLLQENPDGLRFSELNKFVAQNDTSLHPKTINGCIWKLTSNFPDEVEKPTKGVFRLRSSL